MEQSKQQRIRELTDRLNRCRYEYYNLNAPSLTDAEYDALFDELSMLEKETGFSMTNSPTQTVGCYMNYFDLDPEEKKPVRKYSQGMKQKLGIIQAIMENQKLLVLDEPFNALDEKSVKLFRELLIEYKKQEKLIILTSHNKEDIESLCDHTYQIQSGQIIAE